jgi:enoyl-CoA hydratase
MLIETGRHGRHVVLTLNRPEKLNALSYELIDELMDCLNALERDDSVRCLVLTGQGDKAFSAGPTSRALRPTSPRPPRRRTATSSCAARP